jgi:hypothetical protein
MIFRQLMQVTNERHVCRDVSNSSVVRLAVTCGSFVLFESIGDSLVEYTNYKFGNEAT